MPYRTAQLIGCTMKSLMPCRIQNRMNSVTIGGSVIANPRRKTRVAEGLFDEEFDVKEEPLGEVMRITNEPRGEFR